MKHFYIIFIFCSTAVISFSSGEEVHADEPGAKSVTNSYSYSIEYSDAGNHGKYGHKIEVKDGNAKVNVHAEHPQTEEQIVQAPKQQKIRAHSKPNHVKQQVLAYVPAQETHHKEQHNPVQLVQVQKTPSPGKLPIETLDKQQLAVLLAQNKNPFFPLTEQKELKTQHKKPSNNKNTSPQNQHVAYYVPQGHSQYYQVPAQSSKDASAYQNPKIQYTYQHQPSPVKSNVQYPSVSNQQQYYYPETTQLDNNQGYQNYYQHQTPVATHSTPTAQPQVQYTAPITQQYQQQPQQYLYLPQTSGGHTQQYSFSQLQGGSQQGGPVQFLPPHQSQNSHTYPTTPLYHFTKGANIPSRTPELSAYPPSLFSNIQYGSSIYGSSAAYGVQENSGYKPAIESPQTGKTNQYGSYSVPQGINYGSSESSNIGNEIQGGYKQSIAASIPVQDAKSSNFYSTATNYQQGIPESHGNLENLAQLYHHQGTASNVAYKQSTSAAPTAQQSIDYSQFGQNTNQIYYPSYYSNQISNTKQQNSHIQSNSKNNSPSIAPKQLPSYEGPTYVKVLKSHNLPQYYNPNPAVGHAENNVRYVYVQANGAPQSESSKVSNQQS